MRSSVLDSYAVLAYLFGEEGHEKVVEALEKAARSGKDALIAAPNWAEIRYQIERKVGKARWEEVRERLMGLPIDIVPADADLAEAAGEIKSTRRMSLADCFAAALAAREKADLFTGDPEFKQIEDTVRVAWL